MTDIGTRPQGARAATRGLPLLSPVHLPGCRVAGDPTCQERGSAAWGNGPR
jgi:hypothetical protein